MNNGRYRCFVKRDGQRMSKVFPTKQLATAWGFEIEKELINRSHGILPNKTFSDLLERYSNEVSVTKKGARWEQIRIKLIQRYPLAKIPLARLKPSDIADWRDQRLKEVSGPSVARELQLLSAVCTRAVNDWQWLKENPLSKISRPKKGKNRDRRITDDEINRILLALGYTSGKAMNTSAKVAIAFLFAIETAMRAGEIVGLRWEDIDLEKCVAKLNDTKNGYSREVPLSPKAIELLNCLDPETATAFDLSSRSLDTLFRKARDRAMVEGLRFHDTRHEAITRLAKKLDVLDLARVVGHRDIRMLMVYYNEKAEDLAKKL